MPAQTDRRLVAAITAAVAAYLGTPAEAVRVRRIEPAPTGGAVPGWPGPWAMAGRLAQMAGRGLSARIRKEGRH